jgi:pilus assembly protein CpaC
MRLGNGSLTAARLFARPARVAVPLAVAFVAAMSMSIFDAGTSCAFAQAGPVVEDASAQVRRVTVTVNKSVTLNIRRPFSEAEVGQTEIADVKPVTDHTLYVQGRKIGTTNISVFDLDKRLMTVFDLEVIPDTAYLRSKIVQSTDGGGRGIHVAAADGQVVLSGQASDAVAATRAVELATGLAGKDTPVINAMTVAPSQQVMLKVRFLEADRTAGRDLGVNWFGGNKNGLGVSGLGTLSNSASSSAAVVNAQTLSTTNAGATTGASSVGNIACNIIGITSPTCNGNGTISGTAAPLLGGLFPGAAAAAQPFGALLAQVVNTHGLQIDTLISALEDRGLVKTLAEPDLVAMSGENATFFAGTSIPVPTVQPGTIGGTPTVSVQYQDCGVTLNFIPTVLNTGLINLNLKPNVCQVSTTTPVVVNGTTIPELTKRSANTTVSLRDGQSFAIAGLLQAQSTEDIAQLPWLGTIPVLGALFRSTNYQKGETDLVVIVTIHLVRPADPGKKLVTPFDTTLQANDVDLFLMGETERKKKYNEFITTGGSVKGPYGYILQ